HWRSMRRASPWTRSRSSTCSASEASSSRSAVGSESTNWRRSSRRRRTLRGLIRVGQEIARLGWERPGETTDLLDQAEQVLFDLSQGRVQGDFSHIEEL